MKKTLIVYNGMSGNSEKADADALRFACEQEDVTTVVLTEKSQEYSVDGFDKLIVCGGDGTFNVALNKCKDKNIEIFYYPSGTLNEKAKATGERVSVKRTGVVNGELFSYVFATGAFTEIGYSADVKSKKKLKKLAYIGKVFKAYKPYAIEAEIRADKRYRGTYSLIMVVDSDRCFGFRFNRAYTKGGKKLYYLLIKNVGVGTRGKIKMFFPFFRSFFIGFKQEYHSRNIDFFPAERAEILLKEEQVFCVDGEKCEPGKVLKTEMKELVPKVYVL